MIFYRLQTLKQNYIIQKAQRNNYFENLLNLIFAINVQYMQFIM
jgi:hypothetical protein